MNEDFEAALRGEYGYGGVEPSVAAALFRLGLISEERAREEAEKYQTEWRKGWDDAEWWWRLAPIAWEMVTPWWKRLLYLGIPPFSWQSQWIRERRGW